MDSSAKVRQLGENIRSCTIVPLFQQSAGFCNLTIPKSNLTTKLWQDKQIPRFGREINVTECKQETVYKWRGFFLGNLIFPSVEGFAKVLVISSCPCDWALSASILFTFSLARSDHWLIAKHAWRNDEQRRYYTFSTNSSCRHRIRRWHLRLLYSRTESCTSVQRNYHLVEYDCRHTVRSDFVLVDESFSKHGRQSGIM